MFLVLSQAILRFRRGGHVRPTATAHLGPSGLDQIQASAHITDPRTGGANEERVLHCRRTQGPLVSCDRRQKKELRTLRKELKGHTSKCETMYATIDKMDTDHCQLSMEVRELEAELEEREEEQVEIARMQDSPSAKGSRAE